MTSNEMALMANIAVDMQKNEVNDVLDKIRAEIEALPKTYPFINHVDHVDAYVKEDDVLQIFDKYKAESETQESEEMTREEAKEWLMPPTTLSNGNQNDPVNKHWIAYRMAIKALEQEPKTGHWIMTNDYYTGAYGSIDYVECSCCHELSLEEGDFCPNCGAKMVEPRESEG